MSRLFDVMLIVDPREQAALEGLAALSARASGERIAIQLRAKDASDAELITLAGEVASVQPAMSRLIVNGRPSVARAIAADGVHLPEGTTSIDRTRQQLPFGALVGASVHDDRGAKQRVGEGADYLVLGPIGEVPGKPALAPNLFTAIAALSTAPVFALGGIASERDATRAMWLGAYGIAVQRAVAAPDFAEWMSRWLARHGTRTLPG